MYFIHYIQTYASVNRKGSELQSCNIGPTADVVKVIRPIYNFKAGDED